MNRFVNPREEWVSHPPTRSARSVREEVRDDDKFSLIQDLVDAAKKLEALDLRQEIGALNKRLSACEEILQQVFSPPAAESAGTYEQWASDLSLTTAYAGKHIAFIPGKGVVAAAGSLRELADALRPKWQLTEVTIGFVPLLTSDS
jgi:hypothetical protein